VLFELLDFMMKNEQQKDERVLSQALTAFLNLGIL
jgi:hypothetical protein